MGINVGDKVLHRGRSDFVVTGIFSSPRHPGFRIAQFENERYSVKCNADEFEVNAEGYYYLPGRDKPMLNELTVEQAIEVGIRKGNLSPEAALRKREKFAETIAAEQKAAEEAARRLEEEEARRLEEKNDG